jgi:hypothetical protein
LLLAAIPMATALTSWWSSGSSPRGAVAAVSTVVLMTVGGVVAGLPATWERLPGTYLVAGFQSGLDSRVEAVGQWASQEMPPDQRVACDFSICSVVGSYARARLSTHASPMFYTSDMTHARRELSVLTLDYVFLDRRMASQRPVTGLYFFRDVLEGHHDRPLDPVLFEKFDRDPLIDRVYDNGPVQAYNVRRVWRG